MITAMDKNTALVLIDLQKGILKRVTAHPISEVLEKVVCLVEAFREKELPIVVVKVNPPGASWLKLRRDEQGILANRVVQTVMNIALPLTGFMDIMDEIKTQPS